MLGIPLLQSQHVLFLFNSSMNKYIAQYQCNEMKNMLMFSVCFYSLMLIIRTNRIQTDDSQGMTIQELPRHSPRWQQMWVGSIWTGQMCWKEVRQKQVLSVQVSGVDGHHRQWAMRIPQSRTSGLQVNAQRNNEKKVWVFF